LGLKVKELLEPKGFGLLAFGSLFGWLGLRHLLGGFFTEGKI